MAEKKTLAKVVVFKPLGALFGPGAPDADVAPFRKRFFDLDQNTNSQKPYFCNADRTFGCLHLPSSRKTTMQLLAFCEDNMLQLSFSFPLAYL